MEDERRPPRSAAKRADLGAPIDAFFEKQPPALRAILDQLRSLMLEAEPELQSAIKWGNAWFMLNGAMVVGLTAHKAHVNLIVAGPPEAFTDPDHRLTGEGATGRHLKLTDASQIPRESVLAWVRTAADLARAKGA